MLALKSEQVLYGGRTLRPVLIKATEWTEQDTNGDFNLWPDVGPWENKEQKN